MDAASGCRVLFEHGTTREQAEEIADAIRMIRSVLAATIVSEPEDERIDDGKA